MATVPIGLAGPTYTADSIVEDNQRTINYYPEADETEHGIARLYLVPTPGLSELIDLTGDANSGRIRGFLNYKSVLLAVFGRNLYSIDTSWVASQISGPLLPDDGNPVWMSANVADQVFITTGGQGYIYDSSAATLTRITDGDFLVPVSSAFSDQYFMYVRDQAQQWFISALNNGLSWDALDFTTVEAAEDTQRAIYVSRREVWLFGSKKVVIYYNSGNVDFPFDARPGGIIEYGLGADFSLTGFENSLYWLTEKGQVVRATGYQVERISDDSLERSIASYSTFSDAIMWNQIDGGHRFLWLYFPTAGRTWVYDEATGTRAMWHERLYWNIVSGQYEAHLAGAYALFNNTHVVGDRSQAKLYRLSYDSFTDNGDIIRRLRRAPHLIKGIRAGQGRHIHKALRVFAEVGTGMVAADPQLLMRYSDDGSHTWSSDHPASLGAVGDYKTIVEWRRLGSSLVSRTYEVTTTEPAKLLEAYLDVE